MINFYFICFRVVSGPLDRLFVLIFLGYCGLFMRGSGMARFIREGLEKWVFVLV